MEVKTLKGNKEKETEVMYWKGVKLTGRIGKRKRVLFMMMVMMIALSFSACGSKKKEAGGAVNNETKTILGSEQQNSENETEEISDDVFADIFDDIELNGKKVTFPFSLNELGDEYTIDDEPFAVDDVDKVVSYHLYYMGEEIAYLNYLTKEGTTKINRDTKIVRYQTLNIREDKGLLKVRGIGIGNNLSEITEAIPELELLNEREKNGEKKSGAYLGNMNNSIMILTSNGRIYDISIRSER